MKRGSLTISVFVLKALKGHLSLTLLYNLLLNFLWIQSSKEPLIPTGSYSMLSITKPQIKLSSFKRNQNLPYLTLISTYLSQKSQQILLKRLKTTLKIHQNFSIQTASEKKNTLMLLNTLKKSNENFT